MSKLIVTLIDVGAGDSILVESIDSNGVSHFALIDSNDEPFSNSTEIFLRRFLQTNQIGFGAPGRLFDFVMVTHAHSDHFSGVKRLLQVFGADCFYYPETTPSAAFSTVIRYISRSTGKPIGRVKDFRIVNQLTELPNLGDATLNILWPPKTVPGVPNSRNENNNSVVLGLSLNNVKFLLTGDVEADVWRNMTHVRKRGLRFFKVPHHGAQNGLFDAAGNPAWIRLLNNRPKTKCGISTHISPHNHPHQQVLDELQRNGFQIDRDVFRTDKSFHIIVETNGSSISVKHSST